MPRSVNSRAPRSSQSASVLGYSAPVVRWPATIPVKRDPNRSRFAGPGGGLHSGFRRHRSGSRFFWARPASSGARFQEGKCLLYRGAILPQRVAHWSGKGATHDGPAGWQLQADLHGPPRAIGGMGLGPLRVGRAGTGSSPSRPAPMASPGRIPPRSRSAIFRRVGPPFLKPTTMSGRAP